MRDLVRGLFEPPNVRPIGFLDAGPTNSNAAPCLQDLFGPINFKHVLRFVVSSIR